VYIGGQWAGVVGEYRRTVQSGFKLSAQVAGFELDTTVLGSHAKPHNAYTPLSRFPGSTADITFVMPQAMPFAELADRVNRSVETLELVKTYQPVDMFAGATSVNVTYRFTLESMTRTLTKADIQTTLASIQQAVSDDGPITIG
jgi:phenylalanyl-tRNA synthetase beta chain